MLVIDVVVVELLLYVLFMVCSVYWVKLMLVVEVVFCGWVKEGLLW